MINGFHVQDGLYFTKEKDGGITVTITKEGLVDSPIAYRFKFSVDVLASVMASMSVRSETAETWQEAKDFLSKPAENVTPVAPAVDAVTGLGECCECVMSCCPNHEDKEG